MTDNTTAPAMPEGLPAEFWDAQANSVKLPELVNSYNETTRLKAEHEEHLKGLPAKAEDYKIQGALPPGFMIPFGYEPRVDEKDPRIPALRAFAHKHKLSQEMVNEIVGIDLQAQVAAELDADAVIQAEMKKLGENGKARVAAVEAALRGHLDETEYDAVRRHVDSATALSALEKILARLPAPPSASKVVSLPRVADRLYGKRP